MAYSSSTGGNPLCAALPCSCVVCLTHCRAADCVISKSTTFGGNDLIIMAVIMTTLKQGRGGIKILIDGTPLSTVVGYFLERFNFSTMETKIA